MYDLSLVLLLLGRKLNGYVEAGTRFDDDDDDERYSHSRGRQGDAYVIKRTPRPRPLGL